MINKISPNPSLPKRGTGEIDPLDYAKTQSSFRFYVLGFR